MLLELNLVIMIALVVISLILLMLNTSKFIM